MNTSIRRQITLTKKPSGVALLLLDCAGKVNSLGTSVRRELEETLAAVAKDDSITALVLLSGKPDTFIIGADLYEIRKAESAQELYRMARDGQIIFETLGKLKKPVVVGVNGACLGGGMELTLAAHWRIASNCPSTVLGLPETRLGLIPGLGGTQRLPRLIGLKAALGMILSAEVISVEEAAHLKLVDEVVSPGELVPYAEKRALELVRDLTPVRKRMQMESEYGTGAASIYPFEDVDQEKANKLFAMTERSIRIKTKGNYPAQTRVLEVMKTGLFEGIEKGLELEARTFSELAGGEIAHNLISLFFTTDFARQSAAALAAKYEGSSVQNVAVIGGGTMGAAVAALAAAKGLDVLLRVNKASKDIAMERVNGLFPKLKEGETIDRHHSKITAIVDDGALAGADILLEAVIEDVGIKTQVLSSAANVVSPECVIASNTSSLSVSQLAESLDSSSRFLGLHFFHPVDKMPLVEIVSHRNTSRKAVARAADFVVKLGKTPVMVKDGPGFLINRLLTCYLLAAARLAQSGTPLNWLDDAALAFGMPMGPMELLDEVGLDVAFRVATGLHEGLGERMAPPQVFNKATTLGLTGKKSGQGIFIWEEGRKKQFNPALLKGTDTVISEEKADAAKLVELAQWLVLPMVDEAARCLEERIVGKPREIDMAVVLGIGFPAFRGGLLKYADKIGLNELAKHLACIYEQSGVDRKISDLIIKYAGEGRGFYSLGSKDSD